MTPDYALYYRRLIVSGNIENELPEFDLLISAFNSSERVSQVFDRVRAKRKVWMIHPEYCYAEEELPEGMKAVPSEANEVAQVEVLLECVGELAEGASICIDITGFMRNVLMFLVAKLEYLGKREFVALYTEPSAYLRQEETKFSTTTSGVVRPVAGLSSSMGNARDAVVLGVGYDHSLIGEVMNNKDGAAMRPIFSFPSLSPDMYQQSAIRAARSGDKALADEWVSSRRFAPANDPFATAQVVSSVIRELDALSQWNVYLAPLATKVQALGFVLYWLLEGRRRPATSILLPECTTYARETSVGIKRLWAFTVEV